MKSGLFHFDATNEGSPRALCVYFKDPMEVLHCHHTKRALVRLLFLFVFLQYLFFAQGGSRLYPFALGFRKGDDPVTVEGPGTGRLQRGIRRCWHRCISLIQYTPIGPLSV